MAADNHNIFKFVFVFNTLDGFYICKIKYPHLEKRLYNTKLVVCHHLSASLATEHCGCRGNLIIKIIKLRLIVASAEHPNVIIHKTRAVYFVPHDFSCSRKRFLGSQHGQGGL